MANWYDGWCLYDCWCHDVADAVATFKVGGYYAMLPFAHNRFIILNTVYYSSYVTYAHTLYVVHIQAQLKPILLANFHFFRISLIWQ